MPATEAKLLEGKVLAAKIQSEIQDFVSALLKKKLPCPKLLAIQTTNDPSSGRYIGQQEKLAGKLGIEFEKILPGEISDLRALLEKIWQGNQSKVNGIFISTPLPTDFNIDKVLFSLDPQKDVEGIHPSNLGLIVLRRPRLFPPTAYAVLSLIDWAMTESKQEIRGMQAVVIGQSAIVGKPVQMMLGELRVTTRTCNTGTPFDDLRKAVQESDIVVACAGKPGLVKGAWIKQGAVVIDVGTTEVNGRQVGDVEFEEARRRANYMTPVPGGVGPLTVTMLMKNLINAYEWQRNSPFPYFDTSHS